MSFFDSFFTSIIGLVIGLLDLYKWVIIIAAVISWVNPDPYNPIVRFLYSVTEPALRPIRRFIGHRLGPIDLSPLIVIVIILVVQAFFRSLARSM
jgi:YggT family protein